MGVAPLCGESVSSGSRAASAGGLWLCVPASRRVCPDRSKEGYRAGAMPPPSDIRLADRCWSAIAGEVADQLGEPLGAVLGREGARILDPLEPGGRDQRGEALSMLGGEEAVVPRPGDQSRLVPARELGGGVEQHASVEAVQEAPRVAADRAAREDRQ